MVDLEAGPDDKSLAGDIELLPPHLRRAALQKVRKRFPDARAIRETIIYEERNPFEKELPAARAAYDNVQDVLAGVCAAERTDLKSQLPRVRAVVGQMVASMVRNPKAMMWFSRLRETDSYTYSHLIDASVYLIAFGRHLGFPEPVLQLLGLAGLMIDIGKLRVPSEVLHHPGELTPQQFEQVKEHVRHGIDMLHESDTVPGKALEIIARHHERWDGSGYPDGLVAEAIGIFGSMAGIVDVYTAMILDRPYARAKSTLQGLQALYSARDQLFSAALVEQFIQMVGVYPVGSLVELNTQEVGIVIQENRTRRLKPKLMLLLDARKQPYGKPPVLDLFTDPQDPAGNPLIIARELEPGAYGIDLRHYFQ
ncbi:MAG: HD-GYP domain-containing protein, partial [Pseudomonadota bacterium]